MEVLKWLDRPFSKFETWFWTTGNLEMKVLKRFNRPFSRFESRFWDGMCVAAAVAVVLVFQFAPIA